MTEKNFTDIASLHTPSAKLDTRSLTASMQRRLERLSTRQGVAVFNGRSKTGKILAAEAVAKLLDTQILTIDTAKLLSKYIGETEKNLDVLLSSAEKKKAVLFFDEADALFSKGTSVKDSHDRYANQEISYLLQKLEAYNGLSILSTNLKIDIARQLGKRFLLVLLDDDE